MSASQAVSLTCSVAPGRRRVRGWGRRVPVRRACVLRARCGAACGFSSVLVFPAHARARRVFPMLFNPRANPVTASYGNGPRRDHAANVRPRKLTRSRAERPRPVRVRAACNSTLYRSFYSPRSIYEFLFPEISLCDETPPCLIRRRRNPGRSVTNLRRTGSRIFSV